MIKEGIAIVLGAGASTTFGLPLGSVLRDDIAKSLNIRFGDFNSNQESGSPLIVEALKTRGRQLGLNSVKEFVHAGREICEALPLCASIDDVIERHAGRDDYTLCAKLAIAETILRYERRSGLWQDPNKISSPDLSKFDGAWISSLLQLITRGCAPSNLKDAFSRLRVIIFNYDRCFEQFSFLWLKRVYRITDEEAAECLKAAKIVHPYGTVGKLPFQISNRGVPIGCNVNADDLLDISNGIFTYSESRDSIEDKISIDDIVDNSRVFCFFGFAFHGQNIKLLTSEGSTLFNTRHVYSTDVAVPEPRWITIKSRLSQCLNTPDQHLFLNRSPSSCENLLNDFSEDWVEY